MDALTEVHNKEIHLCDAGLLQSATVLATHSSTGHCSFAHPAALVALVSHPVVPFAARGELHYDHCGYDGHVDAFFYRKKKAQKDQAHRSSQGIGGTSSGGSEKSYAGSET
jgi:hypothetical protein